MRWLLVAVGCAACGRGFFNPQPHDGPAGSAGIDAPSPPIAYVQSGAAASAQNFLDLPPPLAQHAGNTNVVIVAWAGGAITSFGDNNSNNYAVAIGPISGPNQVSQSIFYATDIAPGANNIHVELSVTPGYFSGVVIEYAGVDPAHPIDGTVGAQGGASAAASGELHLLDDGDLEVAAMSSDGTISTQFPGFALRSQSSGVLAEDTQCATSGIYAAITADTIPGNWVDEAVGLNRAPR